MTTEAQLARLRADLETDATEHATAPDPRLGRMITTAVRSGRRRRTTRRLLATTATAAATVATVGAVATLAGPFPTLGERLAEPAAPPTASASPFAPTADDPQPLPATGRDLVDTLTGLLPPTFTVRDASDYVFPQDDEMHAGLTVTDDAGSAWVGAGVSATTGPAVGCDDAHRGCSTRVLVDGVELRVQEHVTSSKGCDFTRYEYDRPSGGSVWFGQVNTAARRSPGHDLGVGCDHTITRPRVPLTEQQVEELLTDPAWDALFAH